MDLIKMACACMDELTKISEQQKQALSKAQLVGAMAGGGALTMLARRINADRRMGRQMRLQQGYQGY